MQSHCLQLAGFTSLRPPSFWVPYEWSKCDGTKWAMQLFDIKVKWATWGGYIYSKCILLKWSLKTPLTSSWFWRLHTLVILRNFLWLWQFAGESFEMRRSNRCSINSFHYSTSIIKEITNLLNIFLFPSIQVWQPKKPFQCRPCRTNCKTKEISSGYKCLKAKTICSWEGQMRWSFEKVAFRGIASPHVIHFDSYVLKSAQSIRAICR